MVVNIDCCRAIFRARSLSAGSVPCLMEVDDLPHTAVLPLLAGKRRLLESAVNNGGVLADMHVCVGTITMARNWAHRNINGRAMVSADVIVSCLVECPDACN